MSEESRNYHATQSHDDVINTRPFLLMHILIAWHNFFAFFSVSSSGVLDYKNE